MIVYHGSTEIIQKPDVLHSKNIWISEADFMLRRSKNKQRNGLSAKVCGKKRLRLSMYMN